MPGVMCLRWTPLSRPKSGDPSLLFRRAVLAPTPYTSATAVAPCTATWRISKRVAGQPRPAARIRVARAPDRLRHGEALVRVDHDLERVAHGFAHGAKTRDILSQFLVEAVTLSLLGGLIGILVGLATSLRLLEARPGLRIAILAVSTTRSRLT